MAKIAKKTTRKTIQQPAQKPTRRPQRPPVRPLNQWPWIIGILAIVVVAAIALPIVFKAINEEVTQDEVTLKLNASGFKWSAPRRPGSFTINQVKNLIEPACSLAVEEARHQRFMDHLRTQDRFTLDTMWLRIMRHKLDSLASEVRAARAAANRAAANAAKACDAVRALPSPTPTSAAPAPAPSAAPTPPPPPKPTPADEEYTFTWLNSRTEDCEVWIDGIIPRQILKPGKSIPVTTNTTVTAWARGTKTKQVWKYIVTREEIEKSEKKILKIY